MTTVQFQGAMVLNGPSLKFDTWCYDNTEASAVKASDGTITVTITVPDENQKSLFCADSYAALTVASAKFGIHVGSTGQHSFTWNTTGLTEAEQWDLDTNGIRLFHFTNSTLTTIGQIIDTALLFVPALTRASVPASCAARNLKFMADYANRNMPARTITQVDLPEEAIQSGDFFGIIRLDGLDPMLAWAMGSTTGHTTIAVRDEANELYIHESTAKDSYWPVNGIQRTPYVWGARLCGCVLFCSHGLACSFKEWIARAKNASFNVVHAPLNEENRAKFNTTAALEFFSTVEGLNYGYHNMLWGWIDTIKNNYPCVPPYPVTEDSKCLGWPLIEVLFSVLNKLIPALGDLMFKQAWNFRLGSTGLEPPELYQLAVKKGMNTNQLPTIPEEDSWKYVWACTLLWLHGHTLLAWCYPQPPHADALAGTTLPATASPLLASPWCAASSCATCGRPAAFSATSRRTAASSPTLMTTA